MKIRTYSVGLVLVLGTLLTGCGLKGPLYLPKDQPAKQQSTQPAKTTQTNQTQS